MMRTTDLLCHAGVSTTSRLVASIAIYRRRASHAPFAPGPATGTYALPNKPLHRLHARPLSAWLIADVVETCQSSHQEPSLCRLPTRRRISIASSEDSTQNNPIAIT